MSTINPTTLIDQGTIPPALHSLGPVPGFVCTQLAAMALYGFDATILDGMQSAAFASAAQFVLHASARELLVDRVHIGKVLAHQIGPEAHGAPTTSLVSGYMNSAKLQQQLGLRQLIADATDMASISIPTTAGSYAIRNTWVSNALQEAEAMALRAQAGTPMFASEIQSSITQMAARYPASIAMDAEVAEDSDLEDEVGTYAPR